MHVENNKKNNRKKKGKKKKIKLKTLVDLNDL
jgi:hypothetical protein